MVLTVDMQLQESLQAKYRGLQLVHRWFLRGITGEPAYPGDLPARMCCRKIALQARRTWNRGCIPGPEGVPTNPAHLLVELHILGCEASRGGTGGRWRGHSWHGPHCIKLLLKRGHLRLQCAARAVRL